jgi:hypothetical protein
MFLDMCGNFLVTGIGQVRFPVVDQRIQGVRSLEFLSSDRSTFHPEEFKRSDPLNSCEYADLPDNSSIRVYGLDEIAVEKVVALTDRVRNEPRDLYDLWYLISEANVDLSMLKSEIDSKLEFRGRSRDAMGEDLEKHVGKFCEDADSIRIAAATRNARQGHRGEGDRETPGGDIAAATRNARQGHGDRLEPST